MDEGDAAFRQQMAQRGLESQTPNDRANVNPLLTFGAGLTGGMADPVGLPVMLATLVAPSCRCGKSVELSA